MSAMSARIFLKSDEIAPPVGPYSHGVQAGGLVFLSGQIPLDPGGNLIQGSIEAETERVIRNLEAVLKTRSLGLADVVKTTVYMTDLALFPRMNEVYARFFGSPGPARATVEVRALPRGARIEIDLIACVPST